MGSIRKMVLRGATSGPFRNPAVYFRLDPANTILAKRYAFGKFALAFECVQVTAAVTDAASVV